MKGFKWRRGRREVSIMNVANFASRGVGEIVVSEVNRLLNLLSFAADQLAFFQGLAIWSPPNEKTAPGRTIPNVKNDGSVIGPYKNNGSAIACELLYLGNSKRFDQQLKGTWLRASDYPAYFEGLRTERPMIASQALEHPATSGLTENYLKPLGISSMLDAPVWVRGKVVGHPLSRARRTGSRLVSRGN